MGIHYLDQLFITNYDEDHVSNLSDLRRTVSIGSLTRNPTVSASALHELKTRDCQPGSGIAELIRMAREYTYPIVNSPDWGGIEFRTFWNTYPYDFDDENNLSMVVFVHHPQVSILFAGDLEKAGWRRLLQNPAFGQELFKVHVLVASHHGRESGCCEELFELGWAPQIVIISDDYKRYQTQETTYWYYLRSMGITFAGNQRHVFTTRSDGNIYIETGLTNATIDTESRRISELANVLSISAQFRR
jgi:beta-lactamase superfamily II metal-dependent hydrolase